MSSSIAEIRHALRLLLRSWKFTTGMILLVALGTGASAAIFGVFDAILLKPLPYDSPDRLVMVWTNFSDQSLEHISVSPPELRDIQALDGSIERLAGFVSGNMNLRTGTEPVRLRSTWVTEDFFETLGVMPVLGSPLRVEDQQPGVRKVIISHDLWRNRLASNPAIVGETVSLNEKPYEVAGVMGPEFQGVHEADVWLPLGLNEEDVSDASRGDHYLRVVARLKPEAGLASLQTELNSLAARLEARFPDTNRNHGIDAVSLDEEVRGAIRPRLIVTSVSVGFLLLLVCLNGMNLMVARTIRRSRDIAVRMALGATRARIARAMLIETLLLGLAGSLLGTFVGLAAARIVVLTAAPAIPGAAVSYSHRTLIFLLLTCAFVSLSLVVVPAARLFRRKSGNLLGSRTTGTTSHRDGRSLLIALETAVAVVILIGAGLAIRSYRALTSVDPGWNPTGLTTMRVQLPSQSYDDDAARRQFADRLLESMRAEPGIDSVAISNALPLTDEGNDRSFFIEGSDFSFAQREPTVFVRIVSDDFFPTLGIPILRGRPVVDEDREGTPPVAVVSQGMSDRYWPSDGAVGHRITFDDIRDDPQWIEIVGIAGDVRSIDIAEEPPLEVYLPARQRPLSSLFVAVRSGAGTAGVLGSVRERLRRMDPALPLFDVSSASEIVERSLATRRLTASVLAAFALVALLLAASGIFAVVSYVVASRTSEIGIRIAIGATARNVFVLVLERAMRPVIAGVILGAIGSLVMSRALARVVFEIRTTDPETYVVVAALMIVTSFCAALVPGFRASRVQPAESMRVE